MPQESLSPEQIETMVMEKFPVHPREAACFNFAVQRQWEREQYRKRLIEGLPKIQHSDS